MRWAGRCDRLSTFMLLTRAVPALMLRLMKSLTTSSEYEILLLFKGQRAGQIENLERIAGPTLNP